MIDLFYVDVEFEVEKDNRLRKDINTDKCLCCRFRLEVCQNVRSFGKFAQF
jgi:hypothetical protein